MTTSATDARVGKILKMRRQMIGLSQAKLGEKSGLSPQQIHKYERGQSSMTASRLVQMASILDVPISFFFDEVEDQSNVPNDFLEMLSDPHCLEAMMTLGTISSISERRRIVDLISVIVNHERSRLRDVHTSERSIANLAERRNASA